VCQQGVARTYVHDVTSLRKESLFSFKMFCDSNVWPCPLGCSRKTSVSSFREHLQYVALERSAHAEHVSNCRAGGCLEQCI